MILINRNHKQNKIPEHLISNRASEEKTILILLLLANKGEFKDLLLAIIQIMLLLLCSSVE